MNNAAGDLGIYLHVPFCRAKCPYCNFYSNPLREDEADRYVEAVERVLARKPYGGYAADTVYFGGGTPTLLGVKRLDRMLQAVQRAFSLRSGVEVTLEANPATVGPEELAALRRCGFNRISFGVQSLREGELCALGRGHTARQAKEALYTAHAAGFDNLSLDLMLGIPGQTPESLSETIREAARLPVSHISAYLLKAEPGTPFYDQYGLPGEKREELSAALYLQAVEELESFGFPQYEISNFAKKGAHSRHNCKYWNCEPYLGIGPSAHSFVGGRRFSLSPCTGAFTRSPDPFAEPVDQGAGGDAEEYAMLRLRLCAGLDARLYRSRCHADPEPPLRRARALEGHGLVRVTADGVISLTPHGFLLSNAVTARILYG